MRRRVPEGQLRARTGLEDGPKGHPKVSKTADRTEEGYGAAEMSNPRSFLGLSRLSRGSPGAAKTAQEGSKRAARRQKMGPGDLQDGLGGFL